MPCLAHTWFTDGSKSWFCFYLFDAIGFLKTRITESPRKNILLMYLSLLTGLAFFLPETKRLIEIRKCKMDDFVFRRGFNFTNIHMTYYSIQSQIHKTWIRYQLTSFFPMISEKTKMEIMLKFASWGR